MQKTNPAGHSKPDQSTHGAAVTPPRPDRLLRLPAVIEMTGLGKSSIYSDEVLAAARVRISARLVGWMESDIYRWLAARPKAGGQ